MDELEAAGLVFVDQGEGGASDGNGNSHALRQALDEGGLAGTEGAAEEYCFAGRQPMANLACQGFGAFLITTLKDN